MAMGLDLGLRRTMAFEILRKDSGVVISSPQIPGHQVELLGQFEDESEGIKVAKSVLRHKLMDKLMAEFTA